MAHIKLDRLKVKIGKGNLKLKAMLSTVATETGGKQSKIGMRKVSALKRESNFTR